MFKIISAILIVIISIDLLLQIDDDINPEAVSFLTKATVTNKNNEAYFYLLGLNAAEGSDPVSVGLAIFTQNDITKTGSHPKLELPSGANFINATTINALFNVNNTSTVLTKHAVLLKRYETFITKKDYLTLNEPSLSSDMLPTYSYLTAGNKLYMLKAIHMAHNNEAKLAVELLMANLSHLRMQLRNADSLIGKLIYTSIIDQNLDVLSILLHQKKVVLNTKLLPLSSAERDFNKAMSRELLFVNNILTDLDKNPQLFEQSEIDFNNETSSEDTPNTPAWLVRILFKPKMSINAKFPYYQKVAKQSRLTPSQFSQSIKHSTPQHTSYSVLYYIRNFVGSILMDTVPEFDQYIVRVFDLNAKISLLNQLPTVDSTNSIANIINPYFNKTGTAYYTKDNASICLTGPSDDDKSRCLKIKLSKDAH